MNQILAEFAIDRGDFQLEVSLKLPAVGISALYGASGSGKTTCLRAIAGLERLPGNVCVAGQVWQDDDAGIFIPPHQRAIGYVFQEASLFPHLNVAANMNFGRSRVAASRQRIGESKVVELLGLEKLLKRSPAALSGGERQRVAIARALLTSPDLLLMDEPLSALDKARKLEILPYLERMHDELALPIIYVSHAADEVTRLADHLVLLEHGHVKAAGPLQDMLMNHQLAGLFNDGASCVIEGVIDQHLEQFASELKFGHFRLRLSQQTNPLGSNVRCRIFASDVSLCLTQPHDTSISNIFPAEVVRIDPATRPGEKLVTLRLDQTHFLLAQISSHSVERLQIRPSHHVWAQVKSVAVL
ncbi:molybdenum ABC transporter ATP-binding protein [Neiella marina]|uniref:Molybdenum ABC transporter ATP-binding protein n=1 Tax=Neiella holothuriorum TaxID=2870530 RepID=A0ABS7EIK5_9GAMM|nr:molybdenum ABC transporter ATP-binding protein [Neiella holothuriorum]MBW8192186.1 molybdenum ABC transporter ATP-binding protein [Neiella holothuriorum]